jgi:alpha-N-arabinofuranosidase
VDALAFRDTAGKLWLSLVNLDPAEDKDIVLELSDVRVARAEGQVLTGPHVNSINTFEAPDTVSLHPIRGTVNGDRVSVSLPAKSVAMLALEE